MTDQAAHSPSGFRYVVTRNDSETGGRMVDDILEPTMRGHAVIVRRLTRRLREADPKSDFQITVERIGADGMAQSSRNITRAVRSSRRNEYEPRVIHAAILRVARVARLASVAREVGGTVITDGARAYQRQLARNDYMRAAQIRREIRPLPGSMTAADRSRLLADLRPMTFEGADLRDLDAACCLAASMCDDDATRQESLSDGDKLAARYARESRAQAKRFRALGERIGKHNAGVA